MEIVLRLHTRMLVCQKVVYYLLKVCFWNWSRISCTLVLFSTILFGSNIDLDYFRDIQTPEYISKLEQWKVAIYYDDALKEWPQMTLEQYGSNSS